jgi:protein SCO1/2
MKRIARLAATLLALAACGSEPHEFTGYRSEPAPQVGGTALPDLAHDGADFALRAQPDDLLLVYFGYTNCPDACPATLGDTAIAEQQIELDSPGAAERIDVAMITVDPHRDLPVMADYVAAFHADGHALGTDDPAALRATAEAFGASYEVDGADVGHSTHLYAVDDTGTVVMTWVWPTELPALTADLRELLEQA